jgi:hypothetical protein
MLVWDPGSGSTTIVKTVQTPLLKTAKLYIYQPKITASVEDGLKENNALDSFLGFGSTPPPPLHLKLYFTPFSYTLLHV